MLSSCTLKRNVCVLAMLDVHAVDSTLLLCEVTCLFWSGAWFMSDRGPVRRYRVQRSVWSLAMALRHQLCERFLHVARCCNSVCCDSVSLYVPELWFYSHFSSATTPHYNATVPQGLYLWSAGEHCHPLWGQGEASSQVRPSLLPSRWRLFIHPECKLREDISPVAFPVDRDNNV